MLAWLFTIYRHTSSRPWGVIRERGITLRLVKSIKRCDPSYISFEHGLGSHMADDLQVACPNDVCINQLPRNSKL